jgi:hypothetical protein
MAYPPQTPSTQHILVEPYCILCRDTLLSLRDYVPPRVVSEPWKLDVFICKCIRRSDSFKPALITKLLPIVFELPSSSHKHESTKPRTHIFRAHLGTSQWLNGPPDTEKVLREANLSLCPYSCDQCDIELTANMVHSICLLLLRSRAQDIKIKASLLCKVTRRLRPLLGWQRGVTMGLPFEHRPSLALSNFGNSASDPLLSAIHEKLPWELQRMIVRRLYGSIASSLSNCLATLESIEWSRMAEEATRRSEFHHSYPFSGLASIPVRLSASTVDILGGLYLASIGSESGKDLEIPTTEAPIQGVEFAFGLHGVVSFRLLYVDESPSSWLGKGRRKWTTQLRCQSLEKLRVVTDVSHRYPRHREDLQSKMLTKLFRGSKSSQ